MKGTISYKDLNETRIKEEYKELKKRRIVLTMEEFSQKIGYGRTYLSRVLNGHEPLTDDIKRKVAAYLNETLNVPSEPPKGEEKPAQDPPEETQQSLIDKMMKFIVLLMEKQNGLVETQTVVMNRQNTILEKNQEFVIEKIENISLTVEAIRQNHEKMIIEIKTSSNGIEGKFQVFEKTIVEKFSTLSQLVKDESRMGFHQQYEEKDKRNQTGNAGKRHKRGS
jgi:transcriptional regulator with XRE-family HTH domain